MVSSSLLAEPVKLPAAERNSDGAMVGKQCLGTITALYDVAGQYRFTLIELQKEIRTAQGGRSH